MALLPSAPNEFMINEERMYRGDPNGCPPFVKRHEVITYQSLRGRYMQADGTVSEQARGRSFDEIWNTLSSVPDTTVQEVSDDEPLIENDVLEGIVDQPEPRRGHVSTASILSSISGGGAEASRMPSLDSQSEGVPFMNIDTSAEATNALHQTRRANWPPATQEPHPRGMLAFHGHRMPDRDWFCSLGFWDTCQSADPQFSQPPNTLGNDLEYCVAFGSK